MEIQKTTQAKTPQLIAERKPFRTHGAMSANWYNLPRECVTGDLPPYWRYLFNSTTERLYVVYSYHTPIAWYTDTHGWTIPNVWYSATTKSKHQYQLILVRDGAVTEPVEN